MRHMDPAVVPQQQPPAPAVVDASHATTQPIADFDPRPGQRFPPVEPFYRPITPEERERARAEHEARTAEIVEAARREQQELAADGEHLRQLRSRAGELERRIERLQSELSALELTFSEQAQLGDKLALAITDAAMQLPRQQIALARQELDEVRGRLADESFVTRVRELDQRSARSAEQHDSAQTQIRAHSERIAHEIRSLIQLAERLDTEQREQTDAIDRELRELGFTPVRGRYTDAPSAVRDELRRALERTPLDVILRR